MYHQRSQQNDNRRTPAARREARGSRSGFTLVEMLVSVALVVIMMSMFATVFQLAAGSVSTQRGIAENDQRARSVVTVIQNDLKNRTFRVVTPFNANEMPLNGTETEAERRVRDFDERVGFFYISENDLNNDADDVLHFTVQLDGTTRDLYFGKAAALFPLSTNSPQTAFLNSNEPDRDDLIPVADGASDSVAAEIVIFMRAGRLYRRVLLIRDPPSSLPANDQPNDSGIDYFDPANDGDTMVGPPTIPEPYANIATYNSAATGNFWNDFDFSAHFGLNAGNVSTGAKFHGVHLLDNSVSNIIPFGDGNVADALANPRFRFGHNQLTGFPREYVGSFDVVAGVEVGNGNDAFIGRFTHEETSFGLFQFPQALMRDLGGNPLNNGNPMEQQNASSTRRLNLVNDIVTDTSAFASVSSPGIPFRGPRRAEDLLLSNVHAFDIKVWDEVMQQFLDVGHNEFIDVNQNGTYDPSDDTYGDYNYLPTTGRNTAYGPNGKYLDRDLDGNVVTNRVFDTWYPQLDLDDADNDQDDTTGQDPPPFRPVDSTTGLPKPLKAIQITIRYLDVSSNQLRQVTQQISLVD